MPRYMQEDLRCRISMRSVNWLRRHVRRRSHGKLKNIFIYIFNSVVCNRFDCEVLSRLSLVFCLGMVLYWYFETQQSQMRFVLLHGRHLSGRVQCSHRATTAMWTTMSSGNPIYHERHLSGRVQCTVVTGPLPTISIMRPGNPIY